MSRSRFDTSSPLWVVTSYFNPAKFERRLRNFKHFRRFLNAPLLVVELERNGDFQLTQDDGDLVVQITGDDRIWQKERLLNVGIENLPDHVEYVAWVDCDVVFSDDTWAQQAIRLFETGVNVMQPFQTISHLHASWTPPDRGWVEPSGDDTFLSEESFCSWFSKSPFSNEVMTGERAKGSNVAIGVAWAGRRSILDRAPIYDGNVIGGGDRPLAYAAIGRANALERSIEIPISEERRVHWITPEHAAHYLEWGAEFSRLVANRFSFLPTRLYHLWHGSFVQRSYMKRYANLIRHGFDPRRDLRVSASGAWEWSNPNGALARDVAAYFDTRREDG